MGTEINSLRQFNRDLGSLLAERRRLLAVARAAAAFMDGGFALIEHEPGEDGKALGELAEALAAVEDLLEVEDENE